MTRVAVFAPSPVLTVTIEDHPTGPDVHVHAGGQGVWQARMLERLGVEVTLCAVLTGEVGRLVKHLAEEEGIEVRGDVRDGRGASYVHDRRDGTRDSVVDAAGDPLARHDLDELYGLTLQAGLECDAIILSGPTGDEELPASVYRRLASDLAVAGRKVIADLSGERLAEALAGGLLAVKVSDSELVESGRVALGGGGGGGGASVGGGSGAGAGASPSVDAILEAMAAMRTEGAGATHVIVTRSSESTLVVSPDGVREVFMPQLQVVDTRGAGDSLTAGVVSVLARGGDIDEALAVGAAAGALNVTRHGLGSSNGDAVRSLVDLVRIERRERA